VGQVQHGRGGFGLSLAPPKWHKAGSAEEAGSQRGAKAGGGDEVHKGHLRVDEMGEFGTMQDGLARPLGLVRE